MWACTHFCAAAIELSRTSARSLDVGLCATNSIVEVVEALVSVSTHATYDSNSASKRDLVPFPPKKSCANTPAGTRVADVGFSAGRPQALPKTNCVQISFR
jgi:uncharacterized protein (UPF0276 family)